MSKSQLGFWKNEPIYKALRDDAWLKTDVSYMEILHVAVNNLTEGLIADDTI